MQCADVSLRNYSLTLCEMHVRVFALEVMCYCYRSLVCAIYPAKQILSLLCHGMKGYCMQCFVILPSFFLSVILKTIALLNCKRKNRHCYGYDFLIENNTEVFGLSIIQIRLKFFDCNL